MNGSRGASGDGALEEGPGNPTPICWPTLAMRPAGGWKDWWRVHERLNSPSPSTPVGAAGGRPRKQQLQSAAGSANCNRAPPLFLLIGSTRLLESTGWTVISRRRLTSYLQEGSERTSAAAKRELTAMDSIGVAWKRRGNRNLGAEKGALFFQRLPSKSTPLAQKRTDF
uniref:BT2A n=1 Tax=Arundo donax TaxID=35708 RepID=A0A0A9ERH1_ARUDO